VPYKTSLGPAACGIECQRSLAARRSSYPADLLPGQAARRGQDPAAGADRQSPAAGRAPGQGTQRSPRSPGTATADLTSRRGESVHAQQRASREAHKITCL
jgi:hypothetical protein